ncbi:hypothetical protein ACFOEY_04340 [Paracandidimonas soli]
MSGMPHRTVTRHAPPETTGPAFQPTAGHWPTSPAGKHHEPS